MPESKNNIGVRFDDEPDTARRMALIEIVMDMLKDPEDAMISHNAPVEMYRQWSDAHYSRLVSIVAQQTGADPEQIADKEKRTPEQDRALIEAAGRIQIARLQSVLKSNYHAALQTINAYCLEQAEQDIYAPLRDEYMPDALQKVELVNAPLAAALYYFATNTGVDPRAQANLTDDNKAEIIAIFNRMDAFYKEHRDTLHSEQELARAFIDAESPNPTIARETLEQLNTLAVVPKQHVAPNHKLVNMLSRATKTPEDIVEITIGVSKKGAKKDITATCVLSYEGDNVKISGRQPFTEFDRNVYNAVVSLFVAGNRYFTVDMVWRAMTGKTAHEQATPAQQGAITKSLDKMRFMRAQIDCSEEFKMRRISVDGLTARGGYDDNLLHLAITWVSAGKNTIRAYEILTAPVLYQYSTAVKQVISAPIGLLDVKKLDKSGKPTTRSLEYTERRVIIKGYLMRRIEGMKGKNSLNNRCIAFLDYTKGGAAHEGLYTIAGSPELSQPMPEGLTDTEKTKRKNDARQIREDAAAILDYWKATAYIKGYSIYKEKGVYAGFEIAI